MEPSTTPTSARDLRSDTRGAVLLVAVFMSAFLVGGLWYLIGIGDAAVYKQYMQDGADAVAFSSAVYHARGMNIIALINLVMAAVLMVLVAFKIAQLLLIAANIASCLIGAFLNPVCDLTTAAEPQFEVWVNRVETIVDKILRILYQTSNAVAIGMPWVAEGKAVLTAGDYSSTVKGGMMASISLVPGPLESAVGGAFTKASSAGSGTAPAGGSGGGSSGAKSGGKESGGGHEGMRWGLPVEDDDYANLCKHAGEDVVKFVFLPFGFLGMGGLASGVESFTSGLVGTLVKTFPGYFCGDLSDAAKGLGDTLKKAATDGAKGSIKDMCDKKKADVAKSKDKSSFSYDNCIKAGGKLDSLKSGSNVLGAGKTSKRPYGASTIGDDYYAVWSFDWGSLDDQSGAARGVDIAGWNKAHAGEASQLSKIGLSQAEFYYEPRKEGPKKWRGSAKSTLPFGGEGGLEDEALWNLRWRARLRRLHLPLPSVGGILAEKLGGKIKVPIVGDLLRWPVTKLGDMVDSEVKKVLGPMADGFLIH